MWSYYAGDHAGYCLEFEATDYTPVFGTAQQVKYAESYPEIDFYNTSGHDKVTLSFLTKFSGWSHEREWRILDHDNGPGLRAYPPELLKSVTFGIRMSDANKDKVKAWISKRPSPVALYQAVQGRDKFEVTFTDAL